MLPIAFADCNDPYAWVIRGLLDYGWQDLSLDPHSYPQQSGRGFDLRHLIDPMSNFGIRLVVLSIDGQGQWYRRDESYEFEVRYIRNLKQEDCILLRSDEMAFSRLFPIVRDQPLYSAGYIQEAIQAQVPVFVERRKRREMISSIELQEMLNFPLISPPHNLLQFISQQLRYGQDFNHFHPWRTAPLVSYQQIQTPQQQPQPEQQPHPEQEQFAQQNLPLEDEYQKKPTRQWSIQEGTNRGQLLRADQGIFSQEQTAAVVVLEKSAKLLKFIAGLAIFFGVLAIVNSLFTAYMVSQRTTVRDPDSYLPIIIISFVMGMIGIIGGWVSWYSNRFFADAENKPLFWYPIVFSACYPLTFFIGAPSAIFALLKWKDPAVQKVFRK